MLQGLRSQIYQVADLAAAKAWYTKLLGKPPYFDEPFYVGFDVGGFELGLQPSDNPDEAQAKDAATYWGVSDAEAAYAQLLALGAKDYQPVQDVGGGIKLGAVIDPQGSILGVIENPHFIMAQSQSDADETGPGLTFSMHINQGLLEQVTAGASSASVSVSEYIGECIVDGLCRGYR
ncbi:MAG: VOC family protein [Janthinobacterium lividum]